MHLLLVRPDPGNERFGLGPFFRVEPLGLEYVAAAVRGMGHTAEIIDARFAGSPASWGRALRAHAIGISCTHALEYDRAIALARDLRRQAPDAFVFAGGHAAAAYASPLEVPEFDAICLDDGERTVPDLLHALATGNPLMSVGGLRFRDGGGWTTAPAAEASIPLDVVPLPARDLVRKFQRRYHCLLFKPVWLVETARGCPFRCSFCSVWQHFDRSFRDRGTAHVVTDFEQVGEHVFVVDDLFWHPADRSLELAHALRRRGVRKRWMLVQSRTDVVCRHPELLAAWRPLAEDFDIFLGLEAPTDAGLDRLTKDATAAESVEAARIARELGYGVTGNFVVDPDWGEPEFQELWDFVDAHRFHRAGYTLLTPLPGTDYYHEMLPRISGQPWFKYDMHHALWEPRLGAARFFELYAETWRRSILNLGGQKRWRDWAAQVRVHQIPYLTRVLLRTQRMMRPKDYLAEHAGR